MITSGQMYWLTRLDPLLALLLTLGILSIVAIALLGVVGAAMRDLDSSTSVTHEQGMRLHRKIPGVIILGVVIFTVRAFIPSTKEMAAIVVIPAVANSEKVQYVGDRLYNLAVDWLDALKPEKLANKADKADKAASAEDKGE